MARVAVTLQIGNLFFIFSSLFMKISVQAVENSLENIQEMVGKYGTTDRLRY
jgi:hypothetical protein